VDTYPQVSVEYRYLILSDTGTSLFWSIRASPVTSDHMWDFSSDHKSVKHF